MYVSKNGIKGSVVGDMPSTVYSKNRQEMQDVSSSVWYI